MNVPGTPLCRALERIGRPRLLVVGDLMLDHYVFGKVDRISPEAPIPVLRVEREEDRPGGAASVATMVRRLDADVSIVGAVGRDDASGKLLRALDEAGVDTSGVARVEGRPTTQKTRCIASVQHLLRVDREVDGAYAPAAEAELAASVRRLAPTSDIVLVSDYAKGLLRGGLMAEISAESRRSGKPVIVDPKHRDHELFRGVTALKPNRREAQLATGLRLPEGDEAAWRRAGEALVRSLELEACVITLDKEGIYFVPREGEPRHFPTEARSVYDVTGAGDMTLAMLGVARAAGLPWPEAIALANVAAGVEVTRVGVAPLSRREVRDGILERDHPLAQKLVLAREFEEEILPGLRRRGSRVVFTNGCFDVLHVGHVKYFEFAKKQGDVLVVGLNSDRSVREIKGPGRPLIGESDRAHILAALAAVDYVIVFDEATPIRLIEAIVPDVLLKAEDYRGKTVVGQSVVEGAGGRVVLAPLEGGISTTQIIRDIKERTLDGAAAAAARAAAERSYADVEAEARARLDEERGGTVARREVQQ